ncbi:MAG: FlgD immunoglobulin-like domain containing protein [Candidatus Eisenbacteria bacterium]
MPRSIARLLALFPFAAALLVATPARAVWPHDPADGVALTNGTVITSNLVAGAPDGAGGLFLAWTDTRLGNFSGDVYLEHLDASGHALWGGTPIGVVAAAATGSRNWLQIAPDGTGGAIAVWMDNRNGNSDIFGQRVSAAGAPAWGAGGLAICSNTAYQALPALAVATSWVGIVWADARNQLTTDYDIYWQVVAFNGSRAFITDGVALCNAAGQQYQPDIAGLGSYFVTTWQDARNSATSGYDVYAQRSSAGGSAQWAANGVVVCNTAGTQSWPQVVLDAGGAPTFAWLDSRGATSQVYAQRMSTAGTGQWTANGIAIAPSSGNQGDLLVRADGAGGLLAAFTDARNTAVYGTDIYVQRVHWTGTLQWGASGLALATDLADQVPESFEADGNGGAYVAWTDAKNLYVDLSVQHVLPGGSAEWTSGGVPAANGPGFQSYPNLSPTPGGGLLLTWSDDASGTPSSYTQLMVRGVDRFGRLGAEPAIASVRDVPNDQGGQVKVSWNASALDTDPAFYSISTYYLYRSVPAAALANAAFARRPLVDDAAYDPVRDAGALRVTHTAGVAAYWEQVGTATARHLDSYSLVAPTTSDSLPGRNPRTQFLVDAVGFSTSQYWTSAPDSGYSVDNLAPATPVALTSPYANGTTWLRWQPNTEPDLAGYALYRGGSPAFPADAAHLVATPPDTGWADAAGAPWYYKLVATDTHGNRSAPALLTPAGALDAPERTPAAWFLRAPQPNPAHAGTTLRFGLARDGAIALELFDAAGRRVRTLARGTFTAGEHAVRWDGAGDDGARARAGLYFVRLRAAGFEARQRLAVTD